MTSRVGGSKQSVTPTSSTLASSTPAASAPAASTLAASTLAALALAAAVAVFAVDPGTIVDQPALGGTERVVIVGLPLAVLAALTAIRLPSSGRSLPSGQPRLLAVFVGWMLAGALFSPSPAISFAYAASFGCIALAGRTLGRYSPTLLLGSLAGALPIYLGLAVVTRLTGTADTWVVLDRLTLVSLEANQFARFAAITGIAGLYLLVESANPAARFGGAATALVGFGLIPLTDSRTGLASLIVALGLLLVIRGSRAVRIWVSAFGIAALVALIVGPAGDMLTSDLSRAGTSGGATSLTGRTEIWPVVFDQAVHQPITGYGVGADRSIVSDLSFTVGFEIEHAHNLWLHLFLTTGVVGVGLFAVLIWRQCGSLGARVRTATNPWALALVTFIVLDGISEPVLQNPTASWLAIVAATVLTEQATTRHTRHPAPVSSDRSRARLYDRAVTP